MSLEKSAPRAIARLASPGSISIAIRRSSTPLSNPVVVSTPSHHAGVITSWQASWVAFRGSTTYLWKQGDSEPSNGSYSSLESTSSGVERYVPRSEPWSFSGSLTSIPGRSMKMPLVSIGAKNMSAPVALVHSLMIFAVRSGLSLHSLRVCPV